MWFWFGISLAGIIIVVWTYTIFPWPFDASKFRQDGETKQEWRERIEREKRND